MWLIALTVLGIVLVTRRKVLPGEPMNTERLVTRYASLVRPIAEAYRLKLSLVLAVIMQESRGEPYAQGVTGDYGLMQITQPVVTDYNNQFSSNVTLENTLDSPMQNVTIGCWYLSERIKVWHGDIFNALRAYNAGDSGARKSEAVSVNYANSVLGFQKQIERALINAFV